MSRSRPERTVRSRARRRGYTVVEVLSAMTLFAIGAAGVISMQRVTIQGGDAARRFDVATNIANEWAFRLQRDSMFWTEPNAAKPTGSAYGNLGARTKYLKSLIDNENAWIRPSIPTTGTETESPAYDIFGHELVGEPSAEIVHMFCVQYRLQWMAKPDTNMATPGALVRAEVRVVWARLDQPAIGNCDLLSLAPEPEKYHAVYVTTAIRQNPSQ